MKKLSLLVFLSLLLATPGLYAAKIYKWVDADGNVNYSSLPPEKDAKEMNISSQPSSSAGNKAVDRNESRQKFLDSLDKEREEKAKAEKKTAEEQAVRDKNCETARKNLATLKLGGRQFEMTPEGERRYLEEAEIQARIKQNEEYVKQWCDE